MAESIVSHLIGRALEFLGQSAVDRIAPYFGGRGKLNELQLTMEVIQARLHDAEMRQEAEDGALIKFWLKQLKSAMYRLEDLLEEVTVINKQDEHRASGKLTKVVCFLPSKLRFLKMNKRLSYEAQDIMRELDNITSNMDRFHFNVSLIDQERGALKMLHRRAETYSSIQEEEVIGRDEDKNKILRTLWDCSDVEEDLFVIAIVGMGGLGKTALAQLVYNDKDVQQHFELKCWVCVSDQTSDFKELVGKVLHSITRVEWQRLSVEQLQLDLNQAVNGKKFLLVLDDVWDDNHERWLQLEHLLRGCKQGSKILVTSRSEVVAKSMGVIKPHVLSSLTPENSWALFKSIAFKKGQEEKNPNLVSIGREIVEKCGNVPLVIRTFAGLLYSRDSQEEWERFRDREITRIGQTQTDIMPTLKISYDHLLSQQKQCFAYCSLFPKDYNFDVTRLIHLWMAQGFVESLEDGLICFMELLRRCFFHNLSADEDDKEICQMHDLMHDLAQMVGGEYCLVDQPGENVNNDIRHVWIENVRHPSSNLASWLLTSPHIRSFFISQRSPFSRYSIFSTYSASNLNDIFSSLRRLRALDLGEKFCDSLPDSIGELKHLRYLRVRVISCDLPQGITKLRYLQTLNLNGSLRLIELPREFYKLTNLQHLQLIPELGNFYSRGSLIDMPPRFGELISLQSLDKFIVGENNRLDALSRMNLVGKLGIFYEKHQQNGALEVKKANLKAKKLTVLHLSFDDEELVADEANELLECLQPPSTLKCLSVNNWNGMTFPNWGIDELPNLVTLRIVNCTRCQHLPPFSQLPHLKNLDISNCEELGLWDVNEQDGDIDSGGDDNSVNSSTWACLKSLCSLSLSKMSNLQSLPSGIGGIATLEELSISELLHLKTLPESIGQLTKLRGLQLRYCPELEALPKSTQNLAALQQLRVVGCMLTLSRCYEPGADDWPLIQHIPCIDFL